MSQKPLKPFKGTIEGMKKIALYSWVTNEWTVFWQHSTGNTPIKGFSGYDAADYLAIGYTVRGVGEVDIQPPKGQGRS